MDPSIAQRFHGWLAPRETIRWTGRPVQGFAFQRGDPVLIPFTLFWLAGVTWWTLGATSSGAPLSFWIVGAIFIAVGLHQAFGRYAVDAFQRSKTVYALTDTRALILSGWHGNTLSSIDLRGAAELHLLPGQSSRGTLVFGPINHAGVFWSRRQFERAVSLEFVKIEHAQEVYALVQRLRTEPRAA